MRVNEIFYSLQGEGRWTGTPAVFVRLSGCNLACDFCDTRHQEGYTMVEDEIVAEVAKYPTPHVVITGGEPLLQLTPSLVGSLHAIGRRVHIETNGTIPLRDGLDTLIDWITCSPKDAPLRIQRIDELKLLYRGQEWDAEIERFSGDVMNLTHPECRYLQPLDTGEEALNKVILADTIAYIKEHPAWKLSLQTHKLLQIP